MVTNKQMLSAVIEQVFANQVAVVARQVEATARQAIKKLYPNEQDIIDLVKAEMAAVVRDVAKKVTYHLLGVEENTFDKWRYRSSEDGLHLLASMFQPDLDSLLRQTDLGKLMQEAMTDELRKYQKSRDFKAEITREAIDQVNDLVSDVLKEASARCNFGNLTVEENCGRVTVTLEKDGAVSSGEIDEEEYQSE
jgi:hypothetical protein